MHKKLLLLAFLASCAQMPQKPTQQELTERDSASLDGSCFMGMSKILSGRPRSMVAALYDEENFVFNFIDFGSEYLSRTLTKIADDKEASAELKSVVRKVESLSAGDRTMEKILKDLTPREKEALWSSYYGKTEALIAENILKEQSANGDEIAAFLLAIPQGQMRQEASEAAVLLRSTQPEMDDKTIINKIKGRMSACLIK